MTVFFNVTDAIGPAPNHGITRTERRLAASLAGRPDVGFVAMWNRRLYAVSPDDVGASVQIVDEPRQPVVERFGIDAPPRRPGLARQLVRRGLRPPTHRPPLHPVSMGADDVLLSVGLDWVHGIVDVARRHVFGTGGRYVGFCYDLIPIDHPEWLFPPDPDGFRRHLRSMTDVASRIVCISEHTRRGLLRHFAEIDPARTSVLRLGADSAVDHGPEHDAFARSLFDGEPYVVYCATLDRRKNHQLLYRVVQEWARSGRAGNVVFVGRIGSGVDDLVDCLRHDRSVAGRVVHVDECDDAHLAAVYRRASVAAYPSLSEGWGLGVTEALAHGTPCVVATGSSLEEAGLGVCEALHPLRTGPWAETLASYLDHPRGVPALTIPTWADAATDLLAGVGS